MNGRDTSKTLVRGAAAALGLALAATAAGSAPAVAASYGGQCGGGYQVVNKAAISGGTVFLAYSGSTGKNCAVVVRSSPGGAVDMDAALKRSDSTSWQTDPGDWTEYAGPVYVEAAGQCVDWGGAIGDEWVVRNGTNCG
ncbi:MULTISPECIES: spore-associated protein A [Nocardiopsis]|uniref:Spore-associated protein A n=1 Tax=Nocardiopsis sinuspersici TaxID=501010 RepID=A0A1V3C5D9_9ACTN|nr:MULTISPECIES: spore-associated protein A [Nocardiopsis]OOC55852.1 spore-associated protein A [Nocardiopsis sinuspersici]